MISKDLIKSSIIYTIVGALPTIAGFFLLIFYTHYLTKAQYGTFIIYISFTGFMQLLTNLGLETYIGVSFFESKNNWTALKSKIGTITGYLLIWGIFIIFISSILGENLFKLIFRENDIFFFPYGLMSVITAFFNSYFKTYTSLLINQEKHGRFAVVNLANLIMTIVFSLWGLFMFPFSLVGPMCGRLLSGFGIFIIAFFSFAKESKIRIHLGDELKQTLRFSLPVLIFLLLTWSISSIYPFIMNSLMTLEDIATFGVVIQFTYLLEFILNGMGSSFWPKVYGIIKDNNLTGSTPELNKYFSGFNAITLLIIPASTFFIPLLLPLLITKDYEASFIFLSIINIAFVSRGLYSYFIAPIYLFKKTRVLPKIYLYTAVINIVISIFLIKYFGIWGAVAANLITKILQNVFLYFAARKFFTFNFNSLKFVWLPLIVTIVVISSEYFLTKHNLHFIRLSQMLFSYLMVYIFYRNEVSLLFKDWRIKFLSVKKA